MPTATGRPLPDVVPAELWRRVERGAQVLADADHVLLASHVDADGLTAAAVAETALVRAGIDHETVFEDQLDAEGLERLGDRASDAVLLTDFGSGQLDAIADALSSGRPVVVADHHQPGPGDDAVLAAHCNPVLAGLDGATDCSGAGVAYLLARALAHRGRGPGAAGSPDATPADSPPADPRSPAGAVDPDNRDLAVPAVVGAVGDRQPVDGELVGVNAGIVAEGVAAGVVDERTDLALYGTQTRPLPRLLAYATDREIPGISDDVAGSRAFLADLDVDCRQNGQWRTWGSLDAGERQTVASALMRRAIERGVPAAEVDALVGRRYELPAEQPGTELRSASEFATVLNATARYERADVGLAVARGDRDAALDAARDLLDEHRRTLAEGVELVTERGVTREAHCQWVDLGSAVRPTVVGIVAGMALGSDGVPADRPIVAFADEGDDERKVSARGTGPLVDRGLDLSTVMHEAGTAVGGDGGGHDVAAGATIPADQREAFLATAGQIVADQLNGRETD